MPPPHCSMDAITYYQVIWFQCRNSLYTCNVLLYFVSYLQSFTWLYCTVSLLTDLWSWTPCQQWPLTWWIFVPSFIKIPPPRTLCGIGLSRQQMYGQTTVVAAIFIRHDYMECVNCTSSLLSFQLSSATLRISRQKNYWHLTSSDLC